MSNVIIVASKITLKGTADRAVLETMFFLRIIHSEHPSLLDYVRGVAKAGIALMNVDHQGKFKVILCHPGNFLTGFSQYLVQLFPVIVEEIPSQSN